MSDVKSGDVGVFHGNIFIPHLDDFNSSDELCESEAGFASSTLRQSNEAGTDITNITAMTEPIATPIPDTLDCYSCQESSNSFFSLHEKEEVPLKDLTDVSIESGLFSRDTNHSNAHNCLFAESQAQVEQLRQRIEEAYKLCANQKSEFGAQINELSSQLASLSNVFSNQDSGDSCKDSSMQTISNANSQLDFIRSQLTAFQKTSTVLREFLLKVCSASPDDVQTLQQMVDYVTETTRDYQSTIEKLSNSRGDHRNEEFINLRLDSLRKDFQKSQQDIRSQLVDISSENELLHKKLKNERKNYESEKFKDINERCRQLEEERNQLLSKLQATTDAELFKAEIEGKDHELQMCKKTIINMNQELSGWRQNYDTVCTQASQYRQLYHTTQRDFQEKCNLCQKLIKTIESYKQGRECSEEFAEMKRQFEQVSAQLEEIQEELLHNEAALEESQNKCDQLLTSRAAALVEADRKDLENKQLTLEISSLQNQLEKQAKEYQNSQAVNTQVLQQLDSLKEAQESLVAQLSDKTKQIEDFRQQSKLTAKLLEANNLEMEKRQAALAELSTTNDSLQELNTQLNSRLDNATEARQLSQRRLEEVVGQLIEANESLKASKEKCSSLENDILNLCEKNQSLIDELKTCKRSLNESSNFAEKYPRLYSKYKALQNEVIQIRKIMDQQSSTEKSAYDAASKLQLELTEKRTYIDYLEHQMKSLQETLEQETSNSRKGEQLKEEREFIRLQKSNDLLQQRLDASLEIEKCLKDEIQRLNSQLETRTSQLNDKLVYIESLQQESIENQPKISITHHNDHHSKHPKRTALSSTNNLQRPPSSVQELSSLHGDLQTILTQIKDVLFNATTQVEKFLLHFTYSHHRCLKDCHIEKNLAVQSWLNHQPRVETKAYETRSMSPVSELLSTSNYCGVIPSIGHGDIYNEAQLKSLCKRLENKISHLIQLGGQLEKQNSHNAKILDAHGDKIEKCKKAGKDIQNKISKRRNCPCPKKK